jgi:hypothetical protein
VVKVSSFTVDRASEEVGWREMEEQTEVQRYHQASLEQEYEAAEQ